MDEKIQLLYKIYIVASTIVAPLLLIAVFQNFLLSVILLVISFLIATAKYYLYKTEGELLKVIQFVLNCVYGIWYLSSGKDQNSENDFLFDISWAVFFSVVSFLCLKFSWLIYITVIVCIGILQTITKSKS